MPQTSNSERHRDSDEIFPKKQFLKGKLQKLSSNMQERRLTRTNDLKEGIFIIEINSGKE